MKGKVRKMKKWSYTIDDLNFYAPEPPLLTAIYVVVKNNETGGEYGYSLDCNGIHGQDDLAGEVPYVLAADENYNGNYPTEDEEREIREDINISSVYWDYVKENYRLTSNYNSECYLNECEKKKKRNAGAERQKVSKMKELKANVENKKFHGLKKQSMR